MRYYSTIQRVMVDANTIEKAKRFAQQVVDTTNYSDSNQTFRDKIKDDHFISKIGEEAARLVLMKYAPVTGPDYRIYNAANKSWAADLYIQNTGVAVKTQRRSAAARFGLSWTFQSAPNRSDTILTKPLAWVIFVEYDDRVAGACQVYPPYQMKELTMGEPVLPKLKGFKKVVYAHTLPFR